MKNILIVIAIVIILIFSIIVINGVKINEKLDFNLVYTGDITSILARSGVEERKAWHYEENLIEDDRGWIWESNLNLKPEEIITIVVEGNRIIDYRKS